MLSLEDQRDIFRIQAEVNPIPANRGNPGSCFTNCGQILENSHILVCPKLNEGSSNSYEKLSNGNLHEMKEALTVWRENMKKLEEINPLDSVF